MMRTHTCAQATTKLSGKKVTLAGWVHSRRDHGGVIFIDLRDRYGITQIVFEPKHGKKVHSQSESLRREFVIQVTGVVRARKKGMENPKLQTGQVELLVDELNILNTSEVVPIEIDDRKVANEDMRLKYRYLDLRRPQMHYNLITRHKIIQSAREYFYKNGFIEVETPMLAKSTPEGARDYLVPSRVQQGKFFALPQSPQLFKQLLMVAGMDRYVQIVKCFRDEDLRADRQPEFTQIDLEMSFVDENDIYSIMEGMIVKIWKEVLGINIKTPFNRISYQESLNRFGTDRPDTRFGLELIDITQMSAKCDFSVFKNAAIEGGLVKCLNTVGGAGFSRKDIDELTELARIYGAKGLAWAKMTDKLEGTVAKFLSEEQQNSIIKITNAKKGDIIFFVADKNEQVVNDALANLRLEIAKRQNLIDDNKFEFLWVVDFPLVGWEEEEQRFMALHHPFTSPKDDHINLMHSDPKKVLAKAYDMVLNGTEIGGGSIRIHKREIQQKMFELLGITPDEAQAKFGFLLDAFKYGAPPHGGIAFGLDRLAAIITKNDSIREVIAFPKNKTAMSLMDGAPNVVDDKQLKELHLKLDFVKKK
ncbi:aspartate--tRNA ligase [Candidatus Woesearchaeota archaeon]|nr:aspartate--tRNA ligase [Candidatus Woesearchaeota archaeon]